MLWDTTIRITNIHNQIHTLHRKSLKRRGFVLWHDFRFASCLRRSKPPNDPENTMRTLLLFLAACLLTSGCDIGDNLNFTGLDTEPLVAENPQVVHVSGPTTVTFYVECT